MDSIKKTPVVSKSLKTSKMKKHCFELDLKDTAHPKEEYQAHFNTVRPEIIKTSHEFGVNNLEIYFSGNCLIMILESDCNFSLQPTQTQQIRSKVKDFVTSIWKNHLKLEKDSVCDDWISMKLSHHLKN